MRVPQTTRLSEIGDSHDGSSPDLPTRHGAAAAVVVLLYIDAVKSMRYAQGPSASTVALAAPRLCVVQDSVSMGTALAGTLMIVILICRSWDGSRL